MKIKFVILIFIISYLSCVEKNNDLEKSWILVNQIEKPNSGLTPVMTGVLINFNDGVFTYSYPWNDTSYQEKYIIEDNYIKLDTTTFGKIISLSKDSLIIEADTNSYDMLFLPLSDNQFTELEKQKVEQKLTKGGIRLKTEIYDYTFYFDTTNWVLSRRGQKGLKHFVYHDKIKNEGYWSSNEWWKLKEFQGNLVLEYSSSHIPSNFFQIKKINNNGLDGTYINTDYEKIRLKKSKLEELEIVSKSKLAQTKKSFIGIWKSQEILKPTKTEINNLKENWEESGLALVRYEDKILIDDLENHNLVMIFEENGKYSIFAGKRLIRSGEYWDLTKDLKFLYLDNKLVGQNLYEIKYRDKSRIQLVKAERIYLNLENARDYIYLDIEQNLIKKE